VPRSATTTRTREAAIASRARAELVASLWGGEEGLPVRAVPTSGALDAEHRLLLATARRPEDPHDIVERDHADRAHARPPTPAVSPPARRPPPAPAGMSSTALARRWRPAPGARCRGCA
jgi:hypothetical protein